MSVHTRVPTPLGDVLLRSDGERLEGLWFEGQRHFPPDFPGVLARDDGLSLFRETRRQLEAYFAGERSRFDLPLDPKGTPFQRAVWEALARIEHGALETYAGLARSLGAPSAARAVGAAVGRNPISIVVPCHRVVGSGGALTGFAGGLHRKRALLRVEGHP